LLSVLIEDFEEKAYALKPARPVEVLRALMSANGLRQKDLLDIFATPSIVSEVLREKRALTVEHMRRLSRCFSRLARSILLTCDCVPGSRGRHRFFAPRFSGTFVTPIPASAGLS
jgi:antitoxin component HigA of HigAB toxin-antitoxin module